MAEPEVLWTCLPWAKLTRDQVYALLAARQSVFVVEQQCPYLDLDGVDAQCQHLWAEDPAGRVLAYARLLPPGVHHAEASIGRVLTTTAGRGSGLGRVLMQRAIDAMSTWQAGQSLRIDAQQYLEEFYRSLGFVTDSAVFDLDGIAHVEMLRIATDAVGAC